MGWRQGGSRNTHIRNRSEKTSTTQQVETGHRPKTCIQDRSRLCSSSTPPRDCDNGRLTVPSPCVVGGTCCAERNDLKLTVGNRTRASSPRDLSTRSSTLECPRESRARARVRSLPSVRQARTATCLPSSFLFPASSMMATQAARLRTGTAVIQMEVATQATWPPSTPQS